ncbi:MAG TPA: IS1380 family transposase [Pseudonocardiaceae bacterium]
MRASHTAGGVSVRFDEPNLVSCAGVVPVLRLAERAGLHEAADRRVRLPRAAGSAGANPGAKITSVVAGMVAGADSIDDLGVIRHGGLSRLFGGIRAPSTLGTFLRGFTWGNVRQLDVVARETLTGLARNAPLLPGAEVYAFLDVDSTIEQVYGYQKQGAEYGYTRVRGLHPLLATVSTPIAAPVIAGTRLRRGGAASAKGAAGFVAEAITTARQAGATGTLLARMDSAFDSHAVVTTCVRAGVRFSITTKQTRPVRTAIAAIDPDGWVPIRYPNAIYDEDSGQWISDAQIAETTYTAFRSRRKSEQITLRLIVRRVKDKNVPDRQGELFTAWRYHAFITDSTVELVQAEKHHREHAIIEQVNADLKDSALAHLPSGSFAANAAWLALAAIAHNLTRAAGALASLFHATARTGTIRRHLITLPARITRRSRRITLRLPANWPHRDAFEGLFTATHAPPTRT